MNMRWLLKSLLGIGLSGGIPLWVFAASKAPSSDNKPVPDSVPPAIEQPVTQVVAQEMQKPSDASSEDADKVCTGQLKNGMRYYIHVLPKSRTKVSGVHAKADGGNPQAEKQISDSVSLRVLIHAGALMETPKQDGLAHYIEHLVFNGSEHFKPGTLIDYFQKNGMRFGPDCNAFTDWLYTCYQIDLPDHDRENLMKGLRILSDQASKALFLQSEVDRERGIILSEMRDRDSCDYRAYVERLKFEFPQALWSKHLIIGTKNSIGHLQSSDFFDFYKKWYTPDRMTILVVGAVDADTMVPLLNEMFTQPTAQPIPNPDFGTIVPPKNQLAVKVHSDQALSEVTVNLTALQPHPDYKKFTCDPAATRTLLQRLFVWQVMNHVLRPHLVELRDKTHLLSAHGRFSDHALWDEFRFTFTCQPKDVFETVRLLEQFKRSVESLLADPKEIETAKSIVSGLLQEAVTIEANMTAQEKITQMLGQLMDYGALMPYREILQAYEKMKACITPQVCLEAWRAFWRQGAYLFVCGAFGDGVDAAAIEKTFLASQKQKLTKPKALKTVTLQSPFRSQRAPTLMDYKYHTDLGLSTFAFDNHIRFNLKHTNFDKDRIYIHVSVGCGQMDFKDAPLPGLVQFIDDTLIDGGLKQCSRAELNRLFAGKPIGAHFGINERGYVLSGCTSRAYLLQQLHLLGAYLLEPGYRMEGEQRFKKALPSLFKDFAHTLSGVMETQVADFLCDHDLRLTWPSQAILEQRNSQEARAFLDPIFAQQYMEVTIIGDFDYGVLLQHLMDTFGQLPPRAATKTLPPDASNRFWPKPQTKLFTFPSDDPGALIHIVWPTEASEDPKKRRALCVLAEILSNRLLQELRQALGDTYSPRARCYQSEAYQRGSIQAFIQTAPEKLDVVADYALKIADDLAHHGVTEAELEKAVKPLVSQLEKQSVTNGFWMHWLKDVQSQPEKLMWDLTNPKHFQTATVDQINTLAKRYLNRKLAICSLLKPEPMTKKADVADKAAPANPAKDK